MVDVAVVGSGPNGLAAAITVARAGRSVVVLEAASEPGGAARSGPLTGPGHVNDLGSAIHPLAVASPFMATIAWADHGLQWVTPPAAVAHPLDGGRAAVAWNDLERTVEGLGPGGERWRSLVGPAVDRFDQLVDFVMHPPIGSAARHPLLAARLGPLLALPASVLRRWLPGEAAPALLAGHAAHSVAPLNRPFTGGFGLLLGAAAHAGGWPFPRGGASEIVRVLVEVLEGLGGTVETGRPVRSVSDLPPAGSVIFALTPGQVAGILGHELPSRTLRQYRRYRYGPGACKVDLAIEGPIPWTDPDVGRAATVHLGGTFAEVASAEAEVARGRHPARPFVLLAQHSPFDPTRAPDGIHTVWAYCHVPNGSSVDAAPSIEAQIERFAPGFGERVIARHVSRPVDLERGNANLVGGDVGGGAYTGLQAVFRPGPTLDPFSTGHDRYFIGSAGTAPGGGVHGMAGHLAARRALAALASSSRR